MIRVYRSINRFFLVNLRKPQGKYNLSSACPYHHLFQKTDQLWLTTQLKDWRLNEKMFCQITKCLMLLSESNLYISLTFYCQQHIKQQIYYHFYHFSARSLVLSLQNLTFSSFQSSHVHSGCESSQIQNSNIFENDQILHCYVQRIKYMFVNSNTTLSRKKGQDHYQKHHLHHNDPHLPHHQRGFEWGMAQQYFKQNDSLQILEIVKKDISRQLLQETELKSLKVGQALRKYKCHQYIRLVIDQLFLGKPFVHRQLPYCPTLKRFAKELPNIPAIQQLKQALIKINQPISEISTYLLSDMFAHRRLLKQLNESFDTLSILNTRDPSTTEQLLQQSKQHKDRLIILQLKKSLCQTFNNATLQEITQIQGKSRAAQKACQICFNNKRTLSNPIKTCSKCGIKFHTSCFKAEGKTLCQQCASDFVTKEKRCCLCGFESLPLKTAFDGQNHFSYHIPCIVLAGQAIAEGHQVKPRQKMPHFSEQCRGCGKEGYVVSCKQCGQEWHPVCGYFEGFRFEAVGEKGQLRIKMEMECCKKDWDNKEIQASRKKELITSRKHKKF